MTSTAMRQLLIIFTLIFASTPDIYSQSAYSEKLRISKEWKLQAREGKRALKILAVGNSWTKNSTYYLGNIMNSLGLEVEISRLCANSAPLELYSSNLTNNKQIFDFSKWSSANKNFSSSVKKSFKDAVLSDKFDILVLQQVSYNAGIYSTFQPYLDNIMEWVRENAEIIRINSMSICINNKFSFIKS